MGVGHFHVRLRQLTKLILFLARRASEHNFGHHRECELVSFCFQLLADLYKNLIGIRSFEVA